MRAKGSRILNGRGPAWAFAFGEEIPHLLLTSCIPFGGKTK
jgi:hypothetical protein